jgi:hypothetical protein
MADDGSGSAIKWQGDMRRLMCGTHTAVSPGLGVVIPRTAHGFWVIVLYFDDCSKIGNIGNIGYTVDYQVFSRQHLGNMKSYKKQQIRCARLICSIKYHTV